MLQPILENNLDRVTQLCIAHKIDKLYAFGSVCTDRFTETSDIDLMYSFNSELPIEKYESNFVDFETKIVALLNRRVDLLPEKYVTNPYFIKKVNETKTLLYG